MDLSLPTTNNKTLVLVLKQGNIICRNLQLFRSLQGRCIYYKRMSSNKSDDNITETASPKDKLNVIASSVLSFNIKGVSTKHFKRYCDLHHYIFGAPSSKQVVLPEFCALEWARKVRLSIQLETDLCQQSNKKFRKS